MNLQCRVSILIAIALSLTHVASGLSTIAISCERGETNQVVLHWNAIPGKSYFLLSTSSASQPWSALNPVPIVATTTNLAYVDFNVAGSRFYRVVELAQTLQVSEVGISQQNWPTTSGFVPSNQFCAITATNMLITLGAWWDGNWWFTQPPTDTNGSFVLAVTPILAGYPVEAQVTYQSNPAPGAHSVTPTAIEDSGDGYFLLLQVQGLNQSSPIRDSGYSTNWHTAFGPGDPDAILSATVTTDGSAAQIGDLAVAIFGQDNYEDNNQMSLPAGWTSLGVGDHATDNICYRACYKIVDTPGRQSVTCSWVDTSCFVTAAAIVVFKQAGIP